MNCNSEVQYADILTKALAKSRFKELRKKISMCSIKEFIAE